MDAKKIIDMYITNKNTLTLRRRALTTWSSNNEVRKTIVPASFASFWSQAAVYGPGGAVFSRSGTARRPTMERPFEPNSASAAMSRVRGVEPLPCRVDHSPAFSASLDAFCRRRPTQRTGDCFRCHAPTRAGISDQVQTSRSAKLRRSASGVALIASNLIKPWTPPAAAEPKYDRPQQDALWAVQKSRAKTRHQSLSWVVPESDLCCTASGGARPPTRQSQDLLGNGTRVRH